jgi:hypothetical protein
MNTYRWSFLSVRYLKLLARAASTQTRRTYELCYAQDVHTICVSCC